MGQVKQESNGDMVKNEIYKMELQDTKGWGVQHHVGSSSNKVGAAPAAAAGAPHAAAHGGSKGTATTAALATTTNPGGVVAPGYNSTRGV